MAKSQTNSLEVQIVVAVHSESRPISRAVNSVLRTANAGVIVVAHNIDPKKLTLPDSNRIEIIECDYGEGHPGCPFNLGIRSATAPFLGIMGSDDWFEDGAIDTMLNRAKASSADIVIAPLQVDGTTRSHNPRTLHRKKLQAFRDRLFYRTAPLGLFRREILQDPRYSFVESVVTGDDLLPSIRLWTDGYNICSYPDDPAYVVGNDAVERVTTTPRPFVENLAFINDTFERPDSPTANLTSNELNALAIKLLRVHVLAQTRSRLKSEELSAPDFIAAAQTAKLITRAAPKSAKSLSRSDQRLLEALELQDLSRAHSAVSSSFVVPVLHRDIPRPSELFRHDSEVRQWMTVQAMKARSLLDRTNHSR